MVTISPELKQEVEYQKAATFNCTASGNPSPTLSWRFANNTLISSSKYDINVTGNTKVLLVKNLSRADSGIYECHANNTKGSNSNISKLTVLSK